MRVMLSWILMRSHASNPYFPAAPARSCEQSRQCFLDGREIQNTYIEDNRDLDCDFVIARPVTRLGRNDDEDVNVGTDSRNDIVPGRCVVAI